MSTGYVLASWTGYRPLVCDRFDVDRTFYVKKQLEKKPNARIESDVVGVLRR